MRACVDYRASFKVTLALPSPLSEIYSTVISFHYHHYLVQVLPLDRHKELGTRF